jgi:hypothetical protein
MLQAVTPGTVVREPANFGEAIAVPRSARLDVVAVGDCTWYSRKTKTVTVPAAAKNQFSKNSVVKCANAGSFMMRGQEPSPLSLAELRLVIEYEPDERPLFWLCYPTTSGKYRSPEYGQELELEHPRVFPAAYRLTQPARLW